MCNQLSWHHLVTSINVSIGLPSVSRFPCMRGSAAVCDGVFFVRSDVYNYFYDRRICNITQWFCITLDHHLVAAEFVTDLQTF